MASTGSGEAYDLSSYAVPQPQHKDRIKEVPVRKKKRARSVVIRLQTVCSFVIVVVLVGWMVLNQVWITEVSGDINDISKQLQELESENARMLSELESTISLRAIGEQAKTDLGMSPLNSHQIIHISLEQEDKIELTENVPEQSLGSRIKLAFTDLISSIQEYLAQE